MWPILPNASSLIHTTELKFALSPDFFLESETGCIPNTGRSGCIEELFVGIHTRVCVCTTNFCNGVGGIRVKRDEGEEQKNRSGGYLMIFDDNKGIFFIITC